MRRIWPAIGGLAVLAAAGSLGAGAQVTAQGASARAYAVKVALPEQQAAVTGDVTAPPDGVAVGEGFAYPGDGSVVSTGAITGSASAGTGKGTASAGASSEILSVSLFGGEIVASRVVARATGQADAAGATGDLSAAAVEGLVVLGQTVDTPPAGTRIALGDWGYAIVLAQGPAPAEQGYRGFVTALDVHLTADHGGLPAGSEIAIGFAEVAVAAPPVAETSSQPTTTQGATTAEQPSAKKPAKKAGSKKQAKGLRRPPPALNVKLTPQGYVFPVFGASSFTDTFGAPRADVKWHHGEDIFAPLGSPILAVADGRVFSVGWNDLGGNRLWLRDDQGNEFYYAHLSAYSPLAVNGRRVHAGDVLGFVGNTGDADATPTHLHFEIHPVPLLGLGYDGVISPADYLLAWRRLDDLKFAAGTAWLSGLRPSSAPEPGAYLLSAHDISSLSGLEPGSLRRALATRLSTEAP